MPKTPKTLDELVTRLMELEHDNAELARKLKAVTEVNAQARTKAVLMHSKATKQSNFTNYEVKQYAKTLMDILSKIPLKKI